MWTKGRGFESRQDRRENFLAVFRYPFHTRVTAVSRNISRSICQKYRWAVTAKHACTLCMRLCIKRCDMVVHGCMMLHRTHRDGSSLVWHQPYWAIHARLLTPLTSARHRLSPLAAFTSGAYFLDNGRRWQWICEFFTANFKGFLGGP